MDCKLSGIKARIKKDYEMYNACQRVCDSNYLVSLAMAQGHDHGASREN